MKKIVFTQDSTQHYDSLQIKEIIYERGDDGFLLRCDTQIGNLSIEKLICVDFSQWNELIGKSLFEKAHQLNEFISEKLLNSPYPVSSFEISSLGKVVLRVKNFIFSHSALELRA